jgi:hypothetical protein
MLNPDRVNLPRWSPPGRCRIPLPARADLEALVGAYATNSRYHMM